MFTRIQLSELMFVQELEKEGKSDEEKERKLLS